MPPKNHDHAGEMVFTDSSCYCNGCNQSWTLMVSFDGMGKPKAKWVPEVGNPWD